MMIEWKPKKDIWFPMELKERIIQTAIALFADSGLKFTMQDIAGEMHIAKKTIYHEFESKEDLLLAMLEKGFSEIQKEKQKITGSDLPLPEKLKRVMIALPEEYSVLDFRQLEGLKEKYPLAADELKKHLENNWDPVIRIIREGQEAGIFRNISVPVLRVMVTASIESFLSGGILKEEKIPYETALDEMMTIIMKGIEA